MEDFTEQTIEKLLKNFNDKKESRVSPDDFSRNEKTIYRDYAYEVLKDSSYSYPEDLIHKLYLESYFALRDNDLIDHPLEFTHEDYSTILQEFEERLKSFDEYATMLTNK